jgi:hypothetical protein
VWRPGASASANLKGAISSWNEVDPASIGNGEAVSDCSPWELCSSQQNGILSRHGWAVVNDTGSPRYDDDASAPKWMGKVPWQGAPLSTPPQADWYFFGCGTQYRTCLSDLALLAGSISMPPLSAMGVWWSHYEPYSAESIQTEVLAGFANFSLPLNVLEMDVNWHNQRAVKLCIPFNGYSWNSSLFSDPTAFVATVKTGNWSALVGPAPHRPLKLIINSHNFKGIDRCQPEHDRIAQEAGLTLDPKDAKIGFNTSNYALMVSVFRRLLSADADGVDTSGSRPDWWWTDGSMKQWDESTGVLTTAGLPLD